MKTTILGPDSARTENRSTAILCPIASKVYNLNRIVRFTWPAMADQKILTAGFDRAPSAFAVTPDNQTIYLLAEEAGNEKLYSVPAIGGEVRLAVDMTAGVYTNLAIPSAAPSTMLFANWESAVNPAEVFRIDPAARTHRPISNFNGERVGQIAWQPLRHFWFTSKRGKRIHSLIALPPDFDAEQEIPSVCLHTRRPARDDSETSSLFAGTTTCSRSQATWS